MVMKYRKIHNGHDSAKYAIRLFKGDNVKKSINEFAIAEKVTFAEIRGIGALENVVLGRQIMGTGEYAPVKLEGVWDILTIEGNISLLDKQPMYHLHTALGSLDENNFGKTVGAHFMDGDVAIVCEFFVTVYKDVKMNRVLDDQTQLKLWDL